MANGIFSTYMSDCGCEDQVVWQPCLHGFSVNWPITSFYRILGLNLLNKHLWHGMWRLLIAWFGKLSGQHLFFQNPNFLLQILVHRLPVKELVARTNGSTDSTCERCSHESETLQHTFIHCPRVCSYGSKCATLLKLFTSVCSLRMLINCNSKSSDWLFKRGNRLLLCLYIACQGSLCWMVLSFASF